MAGESPSAFKTSSSSNLIDASSLKSPSQKIALGSAPSSTSLFQPPGTVEVLRSQPLMEKPDSVQNEVVPDSQPEGEATPLADSNPSLHEASLVRDSLQDPSHVSTPQAVAYQHEDEDDLYSLSPEVAARFAQQASEKSSQERAAQLAVPHPCNKPVTPMPPKGSRKTGAITSNEAPKASSSMQRLHELRTSRGAAPPQITEPQLNNIERQTDTCDVARPNPVALPVKRAGSTFKPNLLVPQIPARLTATEKNTQTPAAPGHRSVISSDFTAAPLDSVFTTHKKPGSLQKIKKLANLATNSDSARFSKPTDVLPAYPWEVTVSPEGLKKSSDNIPKKKRGRPRKSDPTPAKAQLVPARIKNSTGTRSSKAAGGSEDDDNDVDYVNPSAKPPATAARPTRASRNSGPLLELPLIRGRGPQKQAARSSKGDSEAAEDHQGQDNVQDLVRSAAEHNPVDERVYRRNDNHETLDEFVDAATNNPEDNHVDSEIAVAKQRAESFKSNYESHQASNSGGNFQGQSGTKYEDQHEQNSDFKYGGPTEESMRPPNGQRQITMRTWGHVGIDTSVEDQAVGTKLIKPERRGTQDAPVDVMSDPPSADDDGNDSELDQYENPYQDQNLDLPKLEANQRAPLVPSSPPAAPKVDGKRFTDNFLRIAERASWIDKPHVIQFSDKGPKNQGTLSGKNTAHSRNHDQSFSTNGRDFRMAVQQRRRPETSAEEAMQEILGCSAKQSKTAVDDTTWIENDAYTDQIASPTHTVLAAKAAPTVCMAPPPKPMVGSASVKPQILTDTSLPSLQQPPSASKVVPSAPMFTTVDRTLHSTTFGKARATPVSKRSKPPEDQGQEQESNKLVKRTNFASSILAASLVTKPMPTSTSAKSGTGIHHTGLGKSMLGSPVKKTQRQRIEDSLDIASQKKAQLTKAIMVTSPASARTSTKRQSNVEYAAIAKRPKVAIGEDAQLGASRTSVEDAASPRKLSQRTITRDGSPVRQEQEESYSQQQLDSEQVSDDEIEAVQDRGRYFANTRIEHVMAQKDVSAPNKTGTKVVEVPELVVSDEAPRSLFEHQSSIAEEESQAISHAGFDRETDGPIVSQHNPLSDPAEDPFVITADERKKKDAVQSESRAQQSEGSFLGRLRLRIRQTIDRQHEAKAGNDKSLDCEQDEDDPDKTLVEAEPGHEYERTDADDDKSSQSPSPYSRKTKVHFEDEFTRRIRALQPHQRSFHDGMFRVVHELVSHLIDAETAVKDVVHDYSSDCAILLEQMEESKRRKVEDYIQSAMTANGVLAKGFKAIAKRIEKDMAEIAARRAESEEYLGQGTNSALTKLDDLLRRFAEEG